MSRKSEAEQVRTIVKTIRFSEEEWSAVEAKLDASKLNWSRFIRRAVSRVTIRPINKEAIQTLRDSRNQLVKIGININAIAKNANTNRTVSVAELEECRNQCKKLAFELEIIRQTIQ